VRDAGHDIDSLVTSVIDRPHVDETDGHRLAGAAGAARRSVVGLIVAAADCYDRDRERPQGEQRPPW